MLISMNTLTLRILQKMLPYQKTKWKNMMNSKKEKRKKMNLRKMRWSHMDIMVGKSMILWNESKKPLKVMMISHAHLNNLIHL
jgi:hypothetical protein